MIDLLREWLEVTREALAAAPENALDTLDRATARRAELRSRLEHATPERPDPDLARALDEAEHAFQERATELRDLLARALREVREAREATRGYRPVRGTRPAFVSRSV